MDLMTINQVQPAYVTFSIPEARLPEIKKYMAHGKVPVFAQLQEAQGAKEAGVLTFVDNAVDLTTGTIKLKATFPNAERRLWPGQFVRVVVRLAIQQNGIVVPNQAVQTGQEGQFVYVVNADRTVEQRPVLVGARVEQDLVIDQGLRPGETVVTEGQLRLAPGSRVQLRGDRGGRPEGDRQKRGKPGS
jgi:multidrug efflux system membrane fusion protein